MRSAKAACTLVALLGCAGVDAVPREDLRTGTVVVDGVRVPDDRDACGGCHQEIMAEWLGSEHRSAWSDSVFAAGYAVDPQPECRACHAPRAEPGRDPAPDSVAARSGIDCRTCHSVHGLAGADPAADPGATLVGSGPSSRCAGCHEFSFPAALPPRPVIFDPAQAMQRTMSEWVASGRPESCQDCHMPWRTDAQGRRHRSHAVRGIADAALLASAVQVAIAISPEGDDTRLEVVVSTDAIGHAFPTGDMFRRAELRVWSADDPSVTQTIVMERRFGSVMVRDEAGRPTVRLGEVRDTRPAPGRPLRRVLRWPGRVSAVQWQLDHLRMPGPQAERQGLVAVNRREVASGRVAVAGPLVGARAR